MHPTNNRIIALKTLKYKNFTKGYHQQKKPSPTFFDSSYQQYLRQNHGLVNLEPSNNHSSIPNLQPHPVLGANTNFNTLDEIINDNYTAQNLHQHNNLNLPNIQTTQAQNNSTHIQDHYHFHPQDITINQTLSRKYYSTATNNNEFNNFNKNEIDFEEPPKETNNNINNFENTWEEDLEETLNPDTYLKTHIEQINLCYENKQYNKINALYQSLRRNNITVPLETYEKILDSFDKRSFDINNKNLDEKMFQLLNCYHDLINNKLKPTEKIYNTILSQIFKNSIVAFESNNLNGLDFFKIGSELFHTVLKNNNLSQETINYYLLSLNLFASSPFKFNNKQNTTDILVPNLSYFKTNIIDSSATYEKDSFYFISLINLSKLKNNLLFLKNLYQEFLLLLPVETNESLRDHQFEIYSMFISSFLETGEVNLANKILENLINEIKLKNGMTENIQLILSNYLISLSKIDSQKAYSLWANFNDLKWVPEFSYDFYLQLMANSFHDWNLTKKIYDYIFPMERIFVNETKSLNSLQNSNLSSYLLYPIHTDTIINSLLDYSLQMNDNEVVYKLLEESIIKSFNFDINLYSLVFNFLANVNCPPDYLLRFIEKHGELLTNEAVTKHNNQNYLTFLNDIVNSTRNETILVNILQMNFFEKICQRLEFYTSTQNNSEYNGLITFLQALWNAPKTVQSYPYYLDLQAILITRLFDFDTYVPTAENKTDENNEFSKFKQNLLEKFERFAINYKTLNINPKNVKNFVSQAVKLSNLTEEYIDYFNCPGDWDKTYPLSLGSQIRNSPKTGIKDFENLKEQGYCFDYETYKELIKHRYVNQQIIEKCYSFISNNDIDELKYLSNLIVSIIPKNQLEKILFLSPVGNHFAFEKQYFFQKSILNYLKDESLSRIINNLKQVDINTQFLSMIKFPENFKSITVQAEFKDSIDLIYTKLFELKSYDDILRFNDICPVLNLNILLKCAIRSGRYEEYQSLLMKFKSSLSEEKCTEIQCEYLIDNLKIDEAIKVIEENHGKSNDYKNMDLYSFAVFLKSCTTEVTDFKQLPQNTLQFSNQLSTLSSFTGLLSYYNINLINLRTLDPYADVGEINYKILDQMLNNLVDGSRLFHANSINSPLDQAEISKIFQLKLKTFHRFKAFLKIPNYNTKDIQKLIEVWARVELHSVDSLFNNIIETIYLNPTLMSNSLSLKYDMNWNFDFVSLQTIVDDILNVYQESEQHENIDKLIKFKTYLKQQQHQVYLKQ